MAPIDPRTAAFLEDFLAAPGRDPALLDRFLLYGPDGPRTGAKPRLKLAFHDFWPDFDPSTSFFAAVLAGRFDVALVEDDSDLAIVSVFGDRRRGARSRRTLFFTGENVRPPLDAFDMAVSFDRIEDARHFRLPLYVLYAYHHAQDKATPWYCQPLLPPAAPTREEFAARKFCAFLYKNPNAERRNVFFHALDSRRRVDSVGWHLNNTGTVVRMGNLPKLRVFARYRFAFAFENASHPGYVTEKIFDCLQAGVVPLYWGAPDIGRDVAAGSFIDVSRFASDEEACEHILTVDDDYDLWRQHRVTPPFQGVEAFHFDAFRLVEWIEARL